MAPPEATGSLTIDQGTGPFKYGDTLTFTTESSSLRGGHEMVSVALFQDTDGDGLETELASEDLVWLTLNHPEQAVILGAGEAGLDKTRPSKGWARLHNYGWKGRQQFIDDLDTVEFVAEP